MFYIIEPERLETIELSWGPHASRESGMCMLEAAAYLAGEEHSAHPQCVSEILGRVGRFINDHIQDKQRNKLKTLIPRMLGTRWDGLDYIRFRMVRFRCAEKTLGDLLPHLAGSEGFMARLDEVVVSKEAEALDQLLADIKAHYLPKNWRFLDRVHHFWRIRLENSLVGLGENIISFTAQFSEADLPEALPITSHEDSDKEVVEFLTDLITAAH
jgi:hypothetical protein